MKPRFNPARHNRDLAENRRVDQAARQSFRPSLSASRTADVNTDAPARTPRPAKQLRILEAGNGAEAGDVGGFFWVPGFSRVDGPDIVPET
jgi:hypothetical protein